MLGLLGASMQEDSIMSVVIYKRAVALHTVVDDGESRGNKSEDGEDFHDCYLY